MRSILSSTCASNDMIAAKLFLGGFEMNGGGFYGESSNAKGRRDALEGVYRRDALQRRERIEASAVRERLERAGGRGERRAPLGLTLAALTAVDAAATGPAERVLDALRRVSGRSDGERNSALRSPNFEVGGGRSRFGHENAGEVAPNLKPGLVVSDSAGEMRSRARDRDRWADGKVEGIAADWLSVEQMRALALAQRRARLFGSSSG
jgi:hypothetical protein